MATVERRHREAAFKALNLDLRPSTRGQAWIDGTRPTMVEGTDRHVSDIMAKAIADAEECGEAAGRLSERADVLAVFDNTLADHDGESWQLMERDEFQDIRETFAVGNHAGAAARRKAGG